MLIPLTTGWAVIVGSLTWALLGVATGYYTHHRPISAFDHDTFLTRLRPFEADGRIYERWFAIRRWKRWLPEGGDIFKDGFNKKHLGGRSSENLSRFVIETRRAEVTHWMAMSFGPVFWVWSAWWLGWVMVVFGVLANLPCIIAQRYNRARLLRVLARRQPH